ncbi:hypothetical protein D3C81_529720 [compost metagenome]
MPSHFHFLNIITNSLHEMIALVPELVAVSYYLFLHLFGLYTQQCLKTQVASPVVVVFHLRHAEHTDDL